MTPTEAMHEAIGRLQARPTGELSRMEPEVERHLSRVLSAAVYRINEKYRKGQKEHGEHLWERPVDYILGQAIDEAIDQVVYLLTLRERLSKEAE